MKSFGSIKFEHDLLDVVGHFFNYTKNLNTKCINSFKIADIFPEILNAENHPNIIKFNETKQ